MTLWPLTLETGRTWRQIFGKTLAALSASVTHSRLGLLRRRAPAIWDTLDALLVLASAPLNAATGLQDGAGWFFWALGHTRFGLIAICINLRRAMREPALAHLLRMGRFGGPCDVPDLGIPGYMALAIASYLRLTSPLAALLATILFMREWRRVAPHPPTRAPAAKRG